MRHFAPVIALLNRSRRENRALRQRRRDDDVLIESLRMRLAMQERRADRWQRAAFTLAGRAGPGEMAGCLVEAEMDEIEDAGRRNNRKATP